MKPEAHTMTLPEAHTMTLRDAFEELLRNDLERELTAKSYEDALKRWEKHSKNPPLSHFNNALMSAFRKTLINAGYAPSTINNTWRHMRAILRRCGPAGYGNPWGVGIIDVVPGMKVVKVVRRFPRIFCMDDLSRIYDACDSRQHPKGAIPAADWWRTLLVFSFNCGARPGDLFRMTTDAIDWQKGTVTFLQSKTSAWHFVPLTESARLHLIRIHSERDRLFPGGEEFRRSKKFDRNWKQLLEVAGIENRLPFYAMRKTCATFWNRTDRGLGEYVLGHSLQGTAATYYLNMTDDLFAAAKKVEQPEAFRRILDDPKLQTNVVCRTNGVQRTDWRLTETTVQFREARPVRMPGRLLRVLQVLISAGGRPVTFDDFRRLVFYDRRELSKTTVKTTITQLRERLKQVVDFPPFFDPVPFIETGYVLRMPI